MTSQGAHASRTVSCCVATEKYLARLTPRDEEERR